MTSFKPFQHDPFLVPHDPPSRLQATTTRMRGTLKGKHGTRYGEMAILIVVPLAAFVCVEALFAYAYHHYPRGVLIVVAAAFACALMWAGAGYRRGAQSTMLYCGVTCAIAVVLSAVCGFWTFNAFLVHFWGAADGPSFTNVLPSDSAQGYADAGKLLFADEARVDTTKAVGYVNGIVYCAAPIMDDAQSARIEFWAVGMDCCTRRGHFYCDDSWNSKAHAGVQIRDTWSIIGDRHDNYMKAIRMAEASYDIVSVPEPLLIRWVANPDQVAYAFHDQGFFILISSAVVFLLFTITAACTISSAG